MPIQSFNPATEQLIKEYDPISLEEIKKKIEIADKRFDEWRKLDIDARIEHIQNLKKVLLKNKEKYAETMVKEMGKTISVARAEVEKCAWNADHFSENAKTYLEKEQIDTEAQESYITFEPLGVLFFVMPWNFPFWQVLRQTMPALIAGNTVLLKHASNVPMSALAIEEAIKEAGLPEGCFQTLLISSSQTEEIVSDFRVKGISLTGGEGAGSAVGALAGKHIKPSVMELGGSDPFIVLADSNPEEIATSYCKTRLKNSGQVCNSPKRVIIMRSVAEKFINKLKEEFEKQIVGDPMDENTFIGPLSSEQILKDVDDQIKKSVEMGAKIVTGGQRTLGMEKGFYYNPTIITDVKPGMPAYHEEIFGPVSVVIVVDSEEEAIKIANDTEFGLGASVWSNDIEHAKTFINKIDAGSVYVNKAVSSDPRLPIGGIGKSGYGRELSEYGIKEFTNIKTVWID